MTKNTYNKLYLAGARMPKWKPYSTIRLPRKINEPAFAKKFLRLNDRKKYFYIEDFKRAGYHCVCLPNNIWYGSPAVKEWCNNNIGPNWCTMGQFFCFQNEQDAMLFKMTWL